MTTPAKDLAKKVAIITGGSGGIGRVVAKRLANDGFAIAVHYAGNPAKAESVVGEINYGGGKAEDHSYYRNVLCVGSLV